MAKQTTLFGQRNYKRFGRATTPEHIKDRRRAKVVAKNFAREQALEAAASSAFAEVLGG